jgi:hypothetical protein
MGGVAGLLTGDPAVIATLVRTLERLRELQGAEGQIASNFEFRQGRTPRGSAPAPSRSATSRSATWRATSSRAGDCRERAGDRARDRGTAGHAVDVPIDLAFAPRPRRAM